MRLDARLRLAGGDLGGLRLSRAEATLAGPRQALDHWAWRRTQKENPRLLHRGSVGRNL
jgi:hypothetical protein